MGKQTILIIGIAGFLVGANAYVLISNMRSDRSLASIGPVFNTAQAYLMPVAQVNYLPLASSTDDDLSNLDAKAAMVYDLKSDRNLFAENITDRLPIASLTKILTAVVAWENFSPNDLVKVQPTAIKVDGERQDLYVDEEISMSSLFRLMLIESSNDAAYAIRDYATTKGINLVDLMNKKATDLGMANTHVIDPAGLDDQGYSTAEDLIRLTKYALRYNSIWNFSRERTAVIASYDGKISHEIKSTNSLLDKIADIFGGKTGYTDNALGCIMLIIDGPGNGDKIIAVVLGSHGRFETMQRLINWTKSSYRWN